MNPMCKGVTVNTLKQQRKRLKKQMKANRNGVYIIKHVGSDKEPASFIRSRDDYREQIKTLNLIIKKTQENYHARSKQYFDERYHIFLLQKTAREQAGLKGIL